MGGDILTLSVKDWGAGFDPAIVQEAHRRRSGGLLSMRLRAEVLKGSVQVTTAPNQGTEVVVRVPLPQAPEDLDRLLRRRRLDGNRLETAFEGRILLDVLAVLIEGGRPDGLDLTAGERRLEDI